MEATHKVQDSRNKLVGFMIDNKFFTDYFVVKNIDLIDNLFITEKRVIESENKLPVIQYKEITKVIYEDLIKQNPFERDIQKDLLAWKNNPLHKVLQVEGSRQIGKTTEILKFAYQNYEYVIYVNLATDEYKFIDTVINEGSHILAMEAYCRKANLPHFVNNDNTILIIDEIQINSKAYNSIRTINGGLDCDFIVTGSYLGQILNQGFFLPAGTVSYAHMFPLSFKEFCRVFNAEKQLMDINLYGKSNRMDYENLDKLFEVYRQIGGYPEVIKKFIDTKKIKPCHTVIQDLLYTFEKESRNYISDTKETLIFQAVYIEAIKEMCFEKRGAGTKLVDTITKVVKSSQKMIVNRDEVSRAIQWLIYSGIIGVEGLYLDGDRLNFLSSRRMYYLDCGLANYIANLAGIPADALEGLLTETFAYAELNRLYKRPYSEMLVKGDIPCFSTYGEYELDFMVMDASNTVYGIEVKTKSGDPKSLKIYIDKKLIDKGIVAKRTIGGHGEKYDSIPIYAVGARFPYHDTNNSVHMSLLD